MPHAGQPGDTTNKVGADHAIAVEGVTIETALQLSAEQVAGPPQQDGDEKATSFGMESKQAVSI